MASSSPSPALRIIPSNEYRRVRWRNGAGWTREICACPLDGIDRLDAAAWDWRLSIAEIEAEASFSLFPGIDRELVLLSGGGLYLHFEAGETQALLPPHQRLRFSGERGLTGAPVDGRSDAFNLMWRRGVVDAALWHRPLTGTMALFLAPGESWALHVLSGHADIMAVDMPRTMLGQGDTALLHAEGKRSRQIVDGGGEVLLVRIRACPAIARVVAQ